MAKNSDMRHDAPYNALGHTEYPKYVGSGDSRRLVNDKFEEDAHAEEFGLDKPEAPEPEPAKTSKTDKKPDGWAAKS